MFVSTSEQCRDCIETLQETALLLSRPENENNSLVRREQIEDELARFSLWVGNIDALHRSESSMSLELRLHASYDVLAHVRQLLENLKEAAGASRHSVSWVNPRTIADKRSSERDRLRRA